MSKAFGFVIYCLIIVLGVGIKQITPEKHIYNLGFLVGCIAMAILNSVF